MIDPTLIEQIKTGARVRVFEGKSKNAFDGIVIACKHGTEPGATFTVRSIISSISVEKVLPFKSPNITKIEIVSSPKKVHRSKLYFVRKMSNSNVRKRLGVSL